MRVAVAVTREQSSLMRVAALILWGGKMWAIGCRKSQEFPQIVGQYIKKFTPKKLKKYNKHFTDIHMSHQWDTEKNP
ncbi:hypothetical protein VP01_2511g2 [Puccinia sorghi]|uniref:Uncharacterized protein n=1 Tax=Puccinia sorghi TaxID=27349 RepID=A0A0L6V679_9BASI|nr:hypothetical protein VP01_2511g2 [Puccinia sorghi]